MRMRPLRAALALVLGLAGVALAAPAAYSVDDGESVSLAIAVPIVASARSTGLISADELEAYTRPLGELTRQLDAVIDRPVAIAIDPMIIASIRVLGSSAPASATAWLVRLEGAGNETFALPYADSDVTLATQAGSPVVLGPPSFDFAINPSLFGDAVDETATPAPEPTEPPDESALPALPTSDDLTAWPYTIESLGWPRGNTVITSDLPAVSSAWDSLILSSGNVARSGAASLVTLDGLTAVISDDAVSTALGATVTAATAEEWSASFAVLDKALAASARVQSGTATVLATLDRGVLSAGTRVAETIDALSGIPGVTLVPLTTVAAQSPVVATVVDEPQDAERVAVVQNMLAAASAEQAFSSIVERPDLIVSPRSLQLLSLTSSSWLTNPTGWMTASSAFLTQSRELLSSVQVVESSSFNLLADNATLPISVSNELDQAVTVYITVRPETALLAIGDSRVKLVVEPNSQAKGQIPVQAISNGTVQALVTLSSPTGVQIGAPQTAEINVQAGWETPIVVILAAVVVAIFGIGIVRNIVRRRVPDDGDPTGTDD